MKKYLVLLLLIAPLSAFGSSKIALDKALINSHDILSLQRGAKTFVNYCLSCHSAEYMRYNRLQDLGLSEQQIKDNLLFASDKIGNTMRIAMRHEDAKEWFITPSPDLSVIARSRGQDWLYTYLRKFYRDDTSPTGWNNLVFNRVNMPHVLYELQGEQRLKTEKRELHGKEHIDYKLELVKPGTLKPLEYDMMVADLVNYLVYMGEPTKTSRIRIGIYTLFFLAVMLVVAYMLKKEYWKDVH
jgi:ubiquinol-cytochrome c reductase cytochrome c1 subunit